MITDKEIKEYNIKVNSNSILSVYNRKKHKRKTLGFILTPALAILGCIILFFTIMLNTDKPIEQIQVDNVKLNFEVESLVSIISHEKANLNLSSTITDEDYLNAIDDFKPFEDIIYQKYNKIIPQSEFEYGDFNGIFNNYKLKIFSSSYEMLVNYNNINDEESEFQGEIKIGSDIYQINGSSEKEIDEVELEIKIYISADEYYCISEEYENDEYSYHFKIKNKNDYSYKLEIEEDEIKLKINKNKDSFEYEIVVLNDTKWEISYKNSKIKLEFMMIILENGKKSYIYTNKSSNKIAI